MYNDPPEKFFTREMFDKAAEDMGSGHNKINKTALPKGLFEGAFSGQSYVDEKGARRIMTVMDFLKMGRVHNFVQLMSISTELDEVMVPDLSKGSKNFSAGTIPLKDEKFKGGTSTYSDMFWYGLISKANTVPTMVSPETGIVERMAIALELANDTKKGRVAILMDTDVYNILNIETGGGYDAGKYWSVSSLGHSTFCGVPVLQAPCPGTGDIYVIDSATTIAFVKDGQIKNDGTFKMGLRLAEEAVVVSADPNSHIVSKKFDEETNDWCVDCWTCGYSHWAFEEDEADEKLKAHAESDEARIFYRRES